MQELPRILLVEDEVNIALAIEHLLTRDGYDVTRVSNGSQALPNIRALSPALVVLDVTLPEMSGYEICQRLRRDPTLPDTPVLMTSARASEAERRKGMAMGANAFLTKPFATKDLRALVRLLLGGTADEN
ncbi:response regulator [Celeribacter arenosi]|uniref:Response regulator n=1 Tax=Celeribacter arenosi TaxID=792649 RepID=A0ABP7K1S0_9RHOB